MRSELAVRPFWSHEKKEPPHALLVGLWAVVCGEFRKEDAGQVTMIITAVLVNQSDSLTPPPRRRSWGLGLIVLNKLLGVLATP